MISIREFIQSFFEATRERLRNPAIGTFVLAWIAINWRFVAILFFSNSKLEDRIKVIEECYLRLDLNLWYPLAAMFVYMMILPNLMAIFDALSQKAIFYRKKLRNENRLNDIIVKNKHRLEDVVAQQEIAAEERQLELIEEGSPDVPNLKLQIENLKNENRRLHNRENSTNQTVQADIDSANTKTTNKTPNKVSKKPASKSTLAPEEQVEIKALPTSDKYPAMRENVIRNVAKSEKEWILLYGFYAGKFGSKEFTRDQIFAAYKETKRFTSNRRSNISANITNLVKQGFVRFLNDDEMLLTDSGKELVQEILNR